jgi:hypothetical protein
MTRLIFVILLISFSREAVARDVWKNVERVIAIGDLHGDYEQYRAVMMMTGLINENGEWIGGRTHLVQTGDIPDRGPDSLKIIRELQSLKKAARKAKGYVHLLIGNHEAMNVYGDLRYVHTGEYQILVDEKSLAKQTDYYERFISHMAGNSPETMVDEAFKSQWMDRYPLGYVEHRVLWQPSGKIAKWVAKNNTVIKINDILFVHGGINPHLPYMTIREINKAITRDLKTLPLPEGSLVESEDSPLWYRGLARNPAETELPDLQTMLEFYDANHIVMGHSPTRGVVFPRFDSRAIIIDVGLAAHYGRGMAALLIEKGELSAIHRGQTIPLPSSDDDLKAYFQKIELLEPDPRYVQKMIQLVDLPEAPDEIETSIPQ